MKLPIPVSQLEEWIPHRPPMVWIDEVIHVTAEEGECCIKVNSDAHYMSREGIRQSSMIEWVAQSFAYVRVTQYLLGFFPRVNKPNAVFLVAIRDAFFSEEVVPSSIKKDIIYRIQVKNAREMGPLILFDGMVFNEEGHCLFRAKLKVYAA